MNNEYYSYVSRLWEQYEEKEMSGNASEKVMPELRGVKRITWKKEHEQRLSFERA